MARVCRERSYFLLGCQTQALSFYFGCEGFLCSNLTIFTTSRWWKKRVLILQGAAQRVCWTNATSVANKAAWVWNKPYFYWDNPPHFNLFTYPTANYEVNFSSSYTLCIIFGSRWVVLVKSHSIGKSKRFQQAAFIFFKSLACKVFQRTRQGKRLVITE